MGSSIHGFASRHSREGHGIPEIRAAVPRCELDMRYGFASRTTLRLNYTDRRQYSWQVTLKQ